MQEQQQSQQQKAQQKQQEEAQQKEMMESILKQIFSPEARERLSRIKLVKPEKAAQIEQYFVKIAQSGQLKQVISENDVVQTLEKISEVQSASSIKFARKGGLDDDW